MSRGLEAVDISRWTMKRSATSPARVQTPSLIAWVKPSSQGYGSHPQGVIRGRSVSF